MAGIEFKRCNECSTDEIAVYHGPSGEIAHRIRGANGFGNLIDGPPPGMVSGVPRLAGSGLLALLMAAAMSVNGARSAADKSPITPPEPELKSIADIVAKMDREGLSRLELSPSDAANITDWPADLAERGIIVSRDMEDARNPPGDLTHLMLDIAGGGLAARVFAPSTPAKDAEPAVAGDTSGLVSGIDAVASRLSKIEDSIRKVSEPIKRNWSEDAKRLADDLLKSAGPNPAPLKSLGLHLCPDGGVVVTEWPEGAGLPPCVYASHNAGHAVGYALASLKAGRKVIREEARAAGQEKLPARPGIMGVDLAGGPDRVGTFTMEASVLTVPGLRTRR